MILLPFKNFSWVAPWCLTLCALGWDVNASAQTAGQTDPCASVADLQAKDPNVFVGFGSGSSAQAAAEQANLDLARTLRQKVSGESSVSDADGGPTYTATTKSTVSEVLVNAKIIRRCQQDGVYSAVATMDKSAFLKALDTSLRAKITKAQNYEKALQTPGPNTDNTLATAKKFYEATQPSFEDDVTLCKTYEGCSTLNDPEAMERLGAQIIQGTQQSSYVLVTTDDSVTALFRQDLISLLEASGTPIVDGSIDASHGGTVASTRRILAQCQANRGGEILAGRPDRVFTVQCTTEAYVGQEKMFRKIYSCTTMTTAAASNTAAAGTCVGRLKAE